MQATKQKSLDALDSAKPGCGCINISQKLTRCNMQEYREHL